MMSKPHVPNATGKKRLLKLADMLIADAKKKKGICFDMSAVASHIDWEKFRIPSYCYSTNGSVKINTVPQGEPPEFKAELSCTTTACAMGLAAISGEFKRAGLGFRVDPGELHITMLWNNRWAEYHVCARKLFDLTDQQVLFLFSPDFYDYEMTGAVGERFVAKRIRDFVAGKAISPAEDSESS